MASTFTPEDVATFENATWSRCASGYTEGFGVLTGEGVGPLLSAAKVSSGSRVLDVGTGTGVVADAAHKLGADVIGIDFSEEILAEARRLYPKVEFRSTSADSLGFDDASFDAVVGNVVLHHLGDPGLALREASRVLRPGGRAAYTVWAQPEKLEAFGVYFAAVEQRAGSADLPHGPLFGVTDREALEPLFTENGFKDVEMETLDLSWQMSSIDSLIEAFGTWAQIDSFPADIRHAIEADVRDAAVGYEKGSGIAIPNPMLLISAVRKG